MIGLRITLEGDNAWPELAHMPFAAGTVTHLAALAGGTEEGLPSVALRGQLEDGSEVVLQTTWRLLYHAARAVEIRYGRPS